MGQGPLRDFSQWNPCHRYAVGEMGEAHRILTQALSQMVVEAVDDAIPDEVFHVSLWGSTQELSVKVDLDPEVERLIKDALELSEGQIERLVGLLG